MVVANPGHERHDRTQSIANTSSADIALFGVDRGIADPLWPTERRRMTVMMQRETCGPSLPQPGNSSRVSGAVHVSKRLNPSGRLLDRWYRSSDSGARVEHAPIGWRSLIQCWCSLAGQPARPWATPHPQAANVTFGCDDAKMDRAGFIALDTVGTPTGPPHGPPLTQNDKISGSEAVVRAQTLTGTRHK